MNSRFSIILISSVFIFGGILFFSKQDAKSPEGTSSVQGTSHTKGEGKKKVTLVEYGDFECPACAAYYPVVEQVFEKYKDDITFQYKNFPLRQIHKNAMAAHRSAAAADRQGKFWDMYDLLYKNRETWTTQTDPTTTFRTYAESLSLDMNKYDSDFKSEAVNAEINADIAAGQKLGVTGTPTFFVDGKKLENPKDVEAFNKAIDDAIKAKSQPQ